MVTDNAGLKKSNLIKSKRPVLVGYALVRPFLYFDRFTSTRVLQTLYFDSLTSTSVLLPFCPIWTYSFGRSKVWPKMSK